MIFEHMDRIVFAGDSVTDMESAQPVGEELCQNRREYACGILPGGVSACDKLRYWRKHKPRSAAEI